MAISSAKRWAALQRQVAKAAERVSPQTPDHGIQGSTSVRELYALQARIITMIDQEIIEARAAGAQWGQLGTSKQQAQQRHRAAMSRQGVHAGQESLTATGAGPGR